MAKVNNLVERQTFSSELTETKQYLLYREPSIFLSLSISLILSLPLSFTLSLTLSLSLRLEGA